MNRRREPNGPHSLRAKLVTPLLWLWVASAATAALAAFWLTGRSAEVALDRVLKDDALALAAQIRWDAAGPRFTLDTHTASTMVYDSFAPSHFTLRTDDGRVLAGNAELDLPALPGADAARGAALFFERVTPWGPLRMVALRARADHAVGVWVIVGESLAKRRLLTEELAQAIFLPAAGLGFIIVPLILLGVRRGLAPAQAVSEAMERRGIDDLSPLPLDQVPDELRSMVELTNDLLRRLGESVASERRFISDAAHQLRTPVAGIRLLVEDLRRVRQADPRQPPDAEVLEELHAVSGRAVRLVRQLLSLARAGAAEGGAEPVPVDLAALLRGAVERQRPAAAAAGRSLVGGPGLAGDRPARALAVPLLLEEALANVMDNALRYGGANVRVDLVDGGDGHWDVRIDDDGPTLPAETRQRMLLPFWRAADDGSEGSGLGLPIAHGALRRMGGDLPEPEALPGGGTRVRLRLRRTDLPGRG